MNMTTDTQTPAQSAELQLEIVDTLERLEVAADEWQELLGGSQSDEPMLSPSWLLPWWRTYGRDRQLAVGLVREEFRLVGVIPLLRRRYWYRPGIPFRRLEPLGADVDEGDGVCSDYLGLIAERGTEQRVTRFFVRSLVSGKFGRWDELVMPAMNGDSMMPQLLSSELKVNGLRVSADVTGEALYIPLPSSWSEYLQLLEGKKRYYIKRALRDFEEWAGSDYSVHQATTFEEIEDGKRILRDLHRERWLADGHAGAFGAKRFANFHDAVMPKLLDEGRLELVWLTVRGEPVAALYNIVAANKVYFYQCGRSLDVPKGLRPGIVMFAFAIQQAIENELDEFDFLGGASQYKSQLGLATRKLLQIRATRSSWLEGLRQGAEMGISCARSLRNRLRSLFPSSQNAPD